ncbi:MAG: dTDP-glucose 4,6-dehydratase [Alphaproteobacteria bacterium]
MKAKNYFVTGGAGFIGSCFVINQIEKGHNVIVYDLLTYAGHEINLKTVIDKNCKLIKGNITDTEKVIQLLNQYEIDAVINFAAESHVDNSINSPSIFIETNINGTYSLLNASLQYYNNLDKNDKKENFKYIQVSTDEVYGSLGDTGKFSENSPMLPNSPYSASKAAGDHLTRAWFETYKLPTLITNCSNNYGPRQYPEKLIPRVIFCALNGEIIPVYGDGKNIRDWIHVEDHVAGIDLVLNKGQIGETYCLGGNAERENINLVRLICSILDNLRPKTDGKSYLEQIKFVPDRPGHDRRYAIDDTKAINELGFKRKYVLEEGLKDTIKWYLDNKEWYENIMLKLTGANQ